MIRASQLAIVAVFLVFHFGQGAAVLAGVKARAFENRPLSELPEIRWWSFAEDRTSEALTAYVRDRLPLRSRLVGAHNRLVYSLFRDAPVDDVSLGRDGWIFLRRTIEASPCSPNDGTKRVIGAFGRFVQSARRAGKQPLVVLSPDKASIYPEYLAQRDRRRFARCAEPRRAALEQHVNSPAGRDFVDLWSRLRVEKRRLLESSPAGWPNDRLRFVYRPRDRHWHYETGRVQAQAIVEHVDPAFLDRSAWPRISGEYLDRPSEMSMRFLQFYLPEPYSSLEDTSPQLESTETSFSDTPEPLRHYSMPNSSVIPRRAVVVHDSFMRWTETFLASSFAETTFAHWDSVKKHPDVVAEHILEADVVILQTVESHSGVWIAEVKRIANWLKKGRIR